MRGALWLALISACAGRTHTAEPAPVVASGGAASDVATAASAGIEDKTFRKLLEGHWASTLQSSPEWATSLGDPRFDHLVSDRSIQATAERQAALVDFLAQAEAIDPIRLGERDALFLELFRGELRAQVASHACRFETWGISPRMNMLVDLQGTLDLQPIATAAEQEAYLARLAAWSEAVGPHLDALRAGFEAGRVANATSIRLVVEMVRKQLSLPVTEWPMYRLPEAEVSGGSGFAEALTRTIEREVRPALGRYGDFLEQTLLPEGRSDERPGLAGLDVGPACYAAQIRAFTTLPLTAEELHQRGLDELAKIHAEAVAPGAAVFGVWDRALLFERLRTEPTLYFEDAGQITTKATEALAAAQAAVPAVFGRLPKTPCVVSVIPEYEAPYTTIAYYRQPSADGTKPGEYFVNTYEPRTRPRHEAEVLAFHESVPGHHLQIALSYELPAVPAFHRFGGTTAFVEGWGLYSERLADELDLYSGEVDRLGMLSFDAWRAARLVVDTGLHHLGWSRAQAEQFMHDNTPLPMNNIRNEVDRYITWPGQAVAYKTGQLEILALRKQAETELGAKFSLSAFHDVVLGQGAVSLPVLRGQVERWIERVRNEP